eukprot:11221929-Lingulodinium_polyedra.AAC.1
MRGELRLPIIVTEISDLAGRKLIGTYQSPDQKEILDRPCNEAAHPNGREHCQTSHILHTAGGERRPVQLGG